MKAKKVLILGSNEFFTLEKSYERAFKSLGLNVSLIHVYKIKKSNLEKFIWKFFKFILFYFFRKKIIKNLFKNKKKFDLIIIFKGLYANETFVTELRNILPNSKIINIFTDNPFDTNYFKDISNTSVLKSISCYDNIFIYSKIILKQLQKRYPFRNFHYLPFGYDNITNKRTKIVMSKKFDLSFIGTADKHRFEYINYLKEFKILLAGEGWSEFELPKRVLYIGNVNFQKSLKVISDSLISLNILRPQNDLSHNMKTFEIPSMGGLMLTKRNLDQNNFFPENFACLMYKNKKELKLKIKKVIKNPHKFIKIKKNGYKLSRRHNYKQRAKYILNKVFE